MESRQTLIQVPAQIVDFRPKADKSYKITFESRELGGEEVAILADNFQGEGWLLFKPNGEITRSDIPEGDAESGVKSQSQRLRDVVFIYWKQLGGKGDFESFKRVYFEKLIEYTKSKLSKEE